jgi:hypothetical protein
MARKHNQHNQDPYEDSPERDDIPTSQDPSGEHDAFEATADASPERTEDAGERGAAAPTEEDLESQGFTPDEVRRLVLISDRAAHSAESRAAEAELRRLRFTRWLIEHGVLDEWSA